MVTGGTTSAVGQDDENEQQNLYLSSKNKDIQKHFYYCSYRYQIIRLQELLYYS